MDFPRRLLCCISLALCLIASFATSATAQEPFRLIPDARFLLGMEWNYIWLSGEMLIPAGGRPASGTSVDLPNDLGVDQGEGTSISFDATILENHRLESDYLLFTPTAIKKATKTFKFQNQTYLAGTNLETRLDFNWARLCYGYRALDMASWQLFPRIGVHYVRCSMTLNGESKEVGMTSNSRSLDGTYPVLGLEIRYALPYGFDLGMELEGIHLITRGYLSMASLKAQWAVHPDIVLCLTGFNRLVQYAEDYQPLNNEWLYSLSGWSAGISFSF
ncbi:MAG TPA: hypothetical protein VMC85_23775 [Desulfomonilaceae bacterium]|nr:hypothetical protein [Desulfomonilaceae bacterium]